MKSLPLQATNCIVRPKFASDGNEQVSAVLKMALALLLAVILFKSIGPARLFTYPAAMHTSTRVLLQQVLLQRLHRRKPSQEKQVAIAKAPMKSRTAVLLSGRSSPTGASSMQSS